MRRELDLAEVSDGRLYTAEDLVRAGCQDCRGCWKCCAGMGKSVILDPWDVFQLERGLGMGFPELLNSFLEWNVVDGVVLPNLRMDGPEERCGFLNQEGRCRIHPFRPGFCRMFPLGRLYQEDGFRYFLQVRECPRQPKTKVRVSRWLGISDWKSYEAFVLSWHRLLKQAEQAAQGKDPNRAKEVSLYLINEFYASFYDTEGDFYRQFARRREAWEAFLAG